MNPTDLELLTQFVSARDERAFVCVVQRYERLVRAVGLRVLRDEHLAEDVFQATFFVLAAQAATLSRSQLALAPWLQTVATNAALQLRRSRLRAQKREAQIVPAAESSPLPELLRILDEEVQRLKPEWRDPLVLCYLDGQTQDQAAIQLGLSKSTLRRRVERGISELRDRFRQNGFLVPMFAVLWNAISTQEVSASSVAYQEELAQAALHFSSPNQLPASIPQNWGSGVDLSQRILTMSRWTHWKHLSLYGISAGLMLALGVTTWIPNSEAGEQASPAKGKRQPASAAASNRSAKRSSMSDFTKGDSSAQAKSRSVKATEEERPAEAVSEPESLRVDALTPENAVLPTVIGLNPGSQPIAVTGGNQQFEGTVNINGKEFKTNDPAEFQKALQQNQGQFPPGFGFENFPVPGINLPELPQNNAGGNTKTMTGGGASTKTQGSTSSSSSSSSKNGFQGTININGKEIKTNDPAEFQRLMQQNQGQFPQPPPGFGTNGFPKLGKGESMTFSAAGGGGNASAGGSSSANANGSSMKSSNASAGGQSGGSSNGSGMKGGASKGSQGNFKNNKAPKGSLK